MLTAAASCSSKNSQTNKYHIGLTGPSGSGKSVRASQEIGNRLKAGDTVVVIDIGQSYLELTKQVGGEYHWGHDRIAKYGSAPLHVYDLEHWSAIDLAHIPTRMPQFMVIDELDAVSNVFPDLDLFIKAAIEQGCSLCLIGQSIEDFKFLSE